MRGQEGWWEWGRGGVSGEVSGADWAKGGGEWGRGGGEEVSGADGGRVGVGQRPGAEAGLPVEGSS